MLVLPTDFGLRTAYIIPLAHSAFPVVFVLVLRVEVGFGSVRYSACVDNRCIGMLAERVLQIRLMLSGRVLRMLAPRIMPFLDLVLVNDLAIAIEVARLSVLVSRAVGSLGQVVRLVAQVVAHLDKAVFLGKWVPVV